MYRQNGMYHKNGSKNNNFAIRNLLSTVQTRRHRAVQQQISPNFVPWSSNFVPCSLIFVLPPPPPPLYKLRQSPKLIRSRRLL